ncbi:hypothetical protein Desdi_0600 [Desulfitobacterium dichloroeliminans LMG P-21439]|uniref:Uncharacterized protein n=1 Tax=Desulfitobacterium dichloroeliminans (strain LMG P-21439 / DCA1) TaxID=871963 RepID=L0F660_DESDL|nr:hypothetical protein [Desulfitobacterium dichloroeliminans]AGA68131.1 hypothetical protein Desdi_0600 [Desulfitobacterium dichloroeliminans LMG P-21439]
MFDINMEAIPLSTVIAASVAILLALRIVLGALRSLLSELLLG